MSISSVQPDIDSGTTEEPYTVHKERARPGRQPVPPLQGLRTRSHRRRFRPAEPCVRLPPPEDTMTDPVGPELEGCLVCGAVGLPERIRVHDCEAFRARHRNRTRAGGGLA